MVLDFYIDWVTPMCSSFKDFVETVVFETAMRYVDIPPGWIVDGGS